MATAQDAQPVDKQDNQQGNQHTIRDYVLLVVGIILAAIGVYLLLDIAVGILLLFVGFTMINIYLARQS